MARIDVTDALLDPDFVDRLVCERLEQLVGDNGLAVNTPSEVPFYGVVTVHAPDALQRPAVGERIKGAITVHTVFRLRSGTDELSADVVLFNGRRFTVADVGDYSHFGPGFVAAVCDLLPFSGGTPELS